MSRDWRRPGSAKGPARLSPTCRSTRRTRALQQLRSGKSGRYSTARGVPRQRHHAASLPSGRSANLRDDQAELSEDFGGGRSLRPVAGGSRPSIHDYGYNENKPYYNFGCATQRNLAAMIDNPADLEQPRPETPAYTVAAQRRVREIPQGRSDDHHLSRSRQGQTQRYRQMISRARQNSEEQRDVTPPPADDYISPGAARVGAGVLRRRSRPPPRCASASEDRRLGKAHLSVHMGGIAAAIEAYHTAPTPNVIMLETEGSQRHPRRPR